MIIWDSLSDDLPLWNTVQYNLAALWVPARETREGWPLLTVETAVNGGSKITNKMGPSLVCWACRAGTRDFCSALAALAGPVQNILFFAVRYCNSFVPHRPVSWESSRAGSPVSQYVSLDPALNVHSTICTSFPMLLKEGQHVDDVSACLSIQITFKLLHAPQQRGINVQLYILYCREVYTYYTVCKCLRKKLIYAGVTINKPITYESIY